MHNSSRSLGLRALAACVALYFACPVFANANAAQAISRDVAQNAAAATVMVSIHYGEPLEKNVSWGTGFIIGDGLVMTNAHVVSDRIPNKIIVHNAVLPPTEAFIFDARYDANEFQSSAVMEYIANTLIANAGIHDVALSRPSTSFDVALLSFAPPSGVRLPALAFSRDAAPDQPAYAIGYPGSDQPPEYPEGAGAFTPPSAPIVMTAGKIKQVINREPLLLMHDALCKTGNSGGPLVNSRGEVLGMQTWSTVPGGDTVASFAIGARDLAAFAEASGLRPAATGQGAPRRRPTSGVDVRSPLLAQANAGNADYLALAGLLHAIGDCGFSRDAAAAAEYLQRALAAAPNHPNAYLFRAGLAAVMLQNPRLRLPHRPEDLLRAANNSAVVDQSSRHPDLRLLAYEAGLLMQGRADGFPCDPQRSRVLAEKALDGGFAFSFALAGLHYYFGDSGARDHHEALALAREAARSGVPEGLSLLAHLYYDSDVAAASHANRQTAFRLASEAARMNDPWALGLLANIYYDSADARERSLAEETARRAVEHGNRMGLYCLGRIAWDAFLANPSDIAQAARAWAFIDLAERKGVRITLPGGNGVALRSSGEILGAFSPEMRQWLISEGRRAQQAIAV